VSATKTSAVIDTQLFLRAAINRKSLPAKIIIDLRNEYNLIASEAILKEAREVLYRPKIRDKFPHLSDDIAEQILSVYSTAVMVEPEDISAVSRDPKDDMFLACAKAAGVQYIRHYSE
jgi:putative PIN family toxin of toxin-antitoxin system